jgi:hypothetical protein
VSGAVENLTPVPDGDYRGLPTRRLANEHVWLDALATAGPRIIRLGLSGSSENILAETPDEGWETAYGRYELLGGHRLWFAPEDPARVPVPDSDGLVLTVKDDGIELDGPPEPTNGIRHSISIRLDPAASAVELCHRLSNLGTRTIELAPWSITQLPTGGLVRLPQPTAISEHIVRPNRIVVLWPYTSWEDRRLQLCDGECRVHADPGARMKVGSFVEGGAVSYTRAGVTLTCRFDPAPGHPHPDLGCNVEVYVDDRFVELEILGPLVELSPGNTVTLAERWELARVAQPVAA